MARTSGLNLANRALDGKLTELLAQWRSENLSFEACARRLTELLGQSITGETARQWAIDLGLWTAKEPAA